MDEKEWFRGTAWDKKSKELFELKLSRSRTSYNRAQYVRIKGSCLLKSNDPFKESEGSKLMQRVINDYPNEVSNVMFAYEQLGDYYFSKKEYGKAAFNYQHSVSFYKEHTRSGSSGIGDIKLAEAIEKSGQTDKFIEMYDLLVNDFKANHGLLILNDDIFRYYSVLAKICNVINRKDEAVEYAGKALQLTKNKSPQFDKYPHVGVIEAEDEELKKLKDISGNS